MHIYTEEWEAADHCNLQNSPVIPLYKCPVSKCTFRIYGYHLAYRHLLDMRHDTDHRARSMTARSVPRMVNVGYNPNYIASGPPVRPHTNRDRPLGIKLDTQVQFEKLLQEDEGKPKEISSAGKRGRPAKYDRRPKTAPSLRDRRQPPTATVTGFSKIKSTIAPVDTARTILGHEYSLKDPQFQGAKRKHRDPKVFDSWKVERGKRIPDFHGSDRVVRHSELLSGQEDATLIWGEKISTVDKVGTAPP